jgi:hypothetical protein
MGSVGRSALYNLGRSACDGVNGRVLPVADIQISSYSGVVAYSDARSPRWDRITAFAVWLVAGFLLLRWDERRKKLAKAKPSAEKPE